MRRTLFLSAAVLAIAAIASPAAATGKLKFKGHPVAGSGPPAVQTIYWGAKTDVGQGAQDPCQGLCTGSVTCPDSTNYFYSLSFGGVTPKNGAVKTYNAVRSTPLPASEDITCTDSGGHSMLIHNVVDRTIAGDRTIRWRDGDVRSSGVSGTAQLTIALSRRAVGDIIVKRRGTTINTTANCNPTTNCSTGGGTVLNGTTIYSGSCNLGNCLTNVPTNTGTFRPELGDPTPVIGPFDFAGRGWAGMSVIGFTFDGEAASYTGNMVQNTGTTSDGYPMNFTWNNNTVIGNTADTYGTNRPNGGFNSCLDCYFHAENNDISFTKYGIQTGQSTGGVSDVFPGSTAPNLGEYYVGHNYIHDTSADSLYQQCPRYFVTEYNIFSDKKTAVTVGTAGTSPPYYNPFDSGRQQHADNIQVNMQITVNTVCAYNLYPGVVYRGNYLLRGNGRDSLPFWTSPPYPNPNNYGGNTGLNGGITLEAKTVMPDTTYALASAQGLAMTNGNRDCPGVIILPWCPTTTPARKFVGNTTTTRDYEATLLNAIVEDNVIFEEFGVGIFIQAMDGGTFKKNTVVAPRVAGRPNISTWTGLGIPRITLFSTYNSPAILGNIAHNGSVINGVAPPSSQIVQIPNIAALPSYFQDPNTWGSPRNQTEYVSGYLPVRGGSAEFDHTNHLYATPYCWDGTPTAANGACPP